MIPSDLASRLKVLIESTVQPTTAVAEISSELPHFDAGQRFSAMIQTALPDGTFRALVAGRTVTLALPESAKSGDVLELIVTDSKSSTVYAQFAEPDGDLNPKPKLSQAGQLISQLLTGRFGEPEPVELAGGRPLIAAPPTRDGVATASSNAATNQAAGLAGAQTAAQVGNDTRAIAPALAAALRQAVAKSGLFFESHQARWVEGNMPVENLLGEPQAREGLRQTLTQQAQAGATTLSPQLRAAVLASGDPSLMKAALAIAQSSPKSAAEAKALQAAVNTNELNKEVQISGKNALRIPDNLMPLVHQQLEALATHHVAWQGQVWPDQFIQWDIYEPGEQHENSNDGGDNGREWKSTLHLTLPKLGGVDAQLILTPAGVALRLDASEAETADRLRAAEQQLRETLDAAGIPVTGMAIIHHANA